MKRAPLCRSLLQVCMRTCVRAVVGVALLGGMGAAGASSANEVRRAQKTAYAVGVRITPSAMAAGSTSMESGADYWSARGFDLETLIAQVYDVDARRVDFPDVDTASARYDVTLRLQQEASAEEMQQLLEDALEKRFGLVIAPESREMQVYVLTAPNGPGPGLRRHAAAVRRASMEKGAGDGDPSEDERRIAFAGKECSGVAAGGITATAETIAEFRRTLEPGLDRLLVDDTRLAGSYDFEIGEYRSQSELFALLRERLGLVMVEARRKVTVLVVRRA